MFFQKRWCFFSSSDTGQAERRWSPRSQNPISATCIGLLVSISSPGGAKRWTPFGTPPQNNTIGCKLQPFLFILLYPLTGQPLHHVPEIAYNFCGDYSRCHSKLRQLVHHSVTGCNMQPGDLLGSGTISGTEQRTGRSRMHGWNIF